MKHAIIYGSLAAIIAVAATSALADDRDHVRTATSIKHLVIIFRENISYQSHNVDLDESAHDNGKMVPGLS
jgi:phospholipase C